MACGQLRNGEFSPLEPPVKEKLNAISWKMKNTAIVMTMNVCRRTCRAMRPKASAMAAPMTPTSGSRSKTVRALDVPALGHQAERVRAAAVEDRVAE